MVAKVKNYHRKLVGDNRDPKLFQAGRTNLMHLKNTLFPIIFISSRALVTENFI